MPIYSNLYSNLARQGFAKTFTHGYAQSLVAATHPSSYPNSHNRTGFGRRASRVGKLGSYQFQNAFHNSVSSPSLTSQEVRLERGVATDGGLDAYFDAWKAQAAEPEKEWTQFQFAKRIEWEPSTEAVDLKAKENEDIHTNILVQGRAEVDQSYSESALNELKELEDETLAVQELSAQQVEQIKELYAKGTESLPTNGTPLHPSSAAAHADLQSQTYASHLATLSDAGRFAEIPAVFEAMLVAGIKPLPASYSALLSSIINIAPEKNQAVRKALDLYHDMRRRSVSPNTATYGMILDLLASRCLEVSMSMKALEDKRLRFGGMNEAGKFMFASNELDFDILSIENDLLDHAVQMFNRSVEESKQRSYSAGTYNALITACADAGRVPDMVRLYDHMATSKVVPMSTTFSSMIKGFSTSFNLSGAVECYNDYRNLAVAQYEGTSDIAGRQVTNPQEADAMVYAALVKAYVDGGRVEGAIKFYNNILSTNASNNALFKEIIISQGFVKGMLAHGHLAGALQWAECLNDMPRIAAMNQIATFAADRGDRSSALVAFSNVPSDFPGVAESAMAMLALHIRDGDLLAASSQWQILSAQEPTTAFIEPTAMYASGLILRGNVAEGLDVADQMFERIRASATGSRALLELQVDEGVAFLARFMTEQQIADPRLLMRKPASYQAQQFAPVQFAVPNSQPVFQDSFDPYAESTDFKGSSLIADELERGSGARVKASRLNEALGRFRNIRRVGRHPRYITYAKLIGAAAREERMTLVHDILGMARADVPLLMQYPVVRYGWVSILDAMVGACLTLGDRTLAAQYHQELLDMGAAPTANTFGLYITTLKESTKTFDEASEAVSIFHRAKSEGVEPSSFLYNALIGKLGKARRIDDCLFYFGEMRALGIKPTSVTYGTIVNALCRVSDEKLAESLFEEMESMPNYKARPAPYNSLMQFFLTTKRDKAKVLFYYERMQSKGIQPTNHTYKLLVDTHATLEPVNMAAAEAILDVIRSTGQKPEAVHYSALIHAKGCVLHDVEGARAVFDSVLADSSIRPQACLYQALFEAMVANHRVSETEPILRNMSAKRVEMTPYIANTLIHGWANEKKIDKCRSIFASVGREKREPSTYEAMTRAYLAVEDREGAKAVVHEMLGRGYPNAVASKIVELVGGGGPVGYTENAIETGSTAASLD